MIVLVEEYINRLGAILTDSVHLPSSQLLRHLGALHAFFDIFSAMETVDSEEIDNLSLQFMLTVLETWIAAVETVLVLRGVSLE